MQTSGNVRQHERYRRELPRGPNDMLGRPGMFQSPRILRPLLQVDVPRQKVHQQVSKLHTYPPQTGEVRQT